LQIGYCAVEHQAHQFSSLLTRQIARALFAATYLSDEMADAHGTDCGTSLMTFSYEANHAKLNSSHVDIGH
jgi:hypothetical protein